MDIQSQIGIRNKDVVNKTYFNLETEIAREEESDSELIIEEGPLCVFQTQISPKDVHEHTKTSLLVEYEKDEQHFNKFQHIERYERWGSTWHSNPSSYEQEDDPLSDVQEEGYAKFFLSRL